MYIFSFGSYSLGPLVSDRILTVRLATHAIVSAAVKTIAEKRLYSDEYEEQATCIIYTALYLMSAK